MNILIFLFLPKCLNLQVIYKGFLCSFDIFCIVPFVGKREFRVLLKDVHAARCNAFTQGSYSNLRTQIRSYFAYCVYFGRTPMPADSNTIYGYAQFLSRSMLPSSVRNYLSGVRTLHLLHGLSYQFTDDYLLQTELRGISRLNPHVPVRAKPITPKILMVFRKIMNKNSSLHCCVWACSLFLFYSLSRLGSLLPRSRTSRRRTFLTKDRVRFTREGLLLTFLQTKTIQFGKRRLHVPLLRIDSELCPVQAYMRVSSAGSVGDPAFTFRKNGKVAWLTPFKFITTFRSVLHEGGVEHASLFTGHSFRRGGATWAFQSGFPGEMIQVLGDWASDAYKRYLEFSMQDKLNLASRFVQNLP